VDWRAELISPAEPIQDGYLTLSYAPGLGYTLNWDLVEARRRARPTTRDSTKVRL